MYGIAAGADLKALRAFAQDIMGEWPSDLDGGSIQELAVKHGLLMETYPTKRCCDEGCRCAEYCDETDFAGGHVICYRKTPALTGIEPAGEENAVG